MLRFGVKQKEKEEGGGQILDDKSPDMSVEELPLLPLVKLYSRTSRAALCTVILGKFPKYLARYSNNDILFHLYSYGSATLFFFKPFVKLSSNLSP